MTDATDPRNVGLDEPDEAGLRSYAIQVAGNEILVGPPVVTD